MPSQRLRRERLLYREGDVIAIVLQIGSMLDNHVGAATDGH